MVDRAAPRVFGAEILNERDSPLLLSNAIEDRRLRCEVGAPTASHEQIAIMKASTRIVLIASANGVCGALLSVAVVLRLIPVTAAIVVAVAAMAATGVLLTKAAADKRREDPE